MLEAVEYGSSGEDTVLYIVKGKYDVIKPLVPFVYNLELNPFSLHKPLPLLELFSSYDIFPGALYIVEPV